MSAACTSPDATVIAWLRDEVADLRDEAAKLRDAVLAEKEQAALARGEALFWRAVAERVGFDAATVAAVSKELLQRRAG